MTKDKIQFVINSLTAGLLIGLCADIYNNVGGIQGAVLFSIGLLSICMCELPLFTGRVGGSNDVLKLLAILALNIIGVLIIRFIFMFDSMVTLGIGCGMLMQVAVVGYKKKLPIVTIFCIAAFILSKYKHCIAYVYNVNVANGVVNVLLIILGNIIGAKIIYYGGVRSD